MNKQLLLLFLGLLFLPSAISASCGLANDNQLIFRISGATDAHAELYDGTSYATEICYNTIFGSEYAGASPHSGNTVLKASAATDAHVEQSNQANYLTNISYGTLVCTYGANCGVGETCIATISGATNAHVSSLCSGAGSYPLKVCCKDTPAAPHSCEITGVDPATIRVYEGATTVSLDYLDFSFNPAASSLDCGDGGASSNFSCVGAGGAGTCSFDCSNYNDLAAFPLAASLLDNAEVVVCTNDGVFIFVYGTIVRIAPTSLNAGDFFDEAYAKVQLSGTGELAEDGEAPVPDSVAYFADPRKIFITVRVFPQGFTWDTWSTALPNRKLSFDSLPEDISYGGSHAFNFSDITDFVTAFTALLPDNYTLQVKTYEFPNTLLNEPPPVNFSLTPGANVPPNSIIDTPGSNQIITVGNSINFTGHGTDTDGVIVVHSWTCVAASGVCPAIFPTNLQNPGSTVFSTVGQYTIAYTVQDDDGAWDPSPATRIITVNAAAGSGAYLRLTKIDVAPENFSGGAPPDFTTLNVAVKNFGDPTVASIGIKVFGAIDFFMAAGTELASATSDTCALGQGEECTLPLDEITVSSLAPGSYKLIVKAFDSDGIEHDSDSVFFVVIGPVPVPELGLVFVPLLALSALAIMFFAGRERKG